LIAQNSDVYKRAKDISDAFLAVKRDWLEHYQQFECSLHVAEKEIECLKAIMNTNGSIQSASDIAHIKSESNLVTLSESLKSAADNDIEAWGHAVGP
jgi:hypothetical protein